MIDDTSLTPTSYALPYESAGPTLVSKLRNRTVVSVAAGTGHFAAITGIVSLSIFSQFDLPGPHRVPSLCSICRDVVCQFPTLLAAPAFDRNSVPVSLSRAILERFVQRNVDCPPARRNLECANLDSSLALCSLSRRCGRSHFLE